MKLSAKVRQRVRREFFPEDFAAVVDRLENWATKDCNERMPQGRMHRYALNLAHGEIKLLDWAISVAKQDWRDLFQWGQPGDPPELTVRLHSVPCPPYDPDLTADDRTFLETIRANPTDNTTRLVYADWLEDRGDPRAAYLRVLCGWLVCRRPHEEPALIERERELRTGLSRRWLAEVRGMAVRDEDKKEAGTA